MPFEHCPATRRDAGLDGISGLSKSVAPSVLGTPSRYDRLSSVLTLGNSPECRPNEGQEMNSQLQPASTHSLAAPQLCGTLHASAIPNADRKQPSSSLPRDAGFLSAWPRLTTRLAPGHSVLVAKACSRHGFQAQDRGRPLLHPRGRS